MSEPNERDKHEHEWHYDSYNACDFCTCGAHRPHQPSPPDVRQDEAQVRAAIKKAQDVLLLAADNHPSLTSDDYMSAIEGLDTALRSRPSAPVSFEAPACPICGHDKEKCHCNDLLKAGNCSDCGEPVYHRPGKPGEYDHVCPSAPSADIDDIGRVEAAVEFFEEGQVKSAWRRIKAVIQARKPIAAKNERRCPVCDGHGVVETHPGYAPEPCTYCEGTGAARPSTQGEDDLFAGIMDFSPSTHTLGTMERGGDYVLKSQVREALRARLASADASARELREALVKIRDREWVENALDPQWAPGIARAALERSKEVAIDP